MAELWVQSQTTAQDRALQRDERHGACSCPQGSTQYYSPGGPLGNLERKPRAKVTWTEPEKGTGEVGEQVEAGSGACSDCASRSGPGAGVGGAASLVVA